jgi:hypothetical protein
MPPAPDEAVAIHRANAIAAREAYQIAGSSLYRTLRA